MTTVAIGMSGGVDSSVAAHLLKQAGNKVIGVTLKLWNDGACGSTQSVKDALDVCEKLGIAHHVMHFEDIFEEKVMKYFVGEYLNGRTPNPCIACNRHVKWAALLACAEKLGAEKVATGHYAKPFKHPVTGRYTIANAASAARDQTYALCSLSQEQLSKAVMPIGDYDKTQIREIAAQIGLSVANKPDSQEICFIPDNDYGAFIRNFTGKQFEHGNFVDDDGNVLGKHSGIANYTIGQRKGLGIAFGKPMFVRKIDSSANEVILSDNENLFGRELTATNVNFMAIEGLVGQMRTKAKIRYAHKPADCTVTMLNDGRINCIFDEPQRAITPGQSVVFYEDGHILAGGTIE